MATLAVCTTLVLFFQKRPVVTSDPEIHEQKSVSDVIPFNHIDSSTSTLLAEKEGDEATSVEVQKKTTGKSTIKMDQEAKEAISDKTAVLDTLVRSKQMPVGRALKYTDLPVNRSNVYAREHIYKMYKSFGHNDYILGDELALYYKNRAEGHTVVNKLIATFVKNNIVRITKQDNGLVAQTVKEDGINNHFKIPMIMDVSLSLQNNASIKVDPAITSQEPLFKNCILLPLEMRGVTIIQEKDTMPRKGYVNGDFLFIDYPGSKLAYKIKN